MKDYGFFGCSGEPKEGQTLEEVERLMLAEIERGSMRALPIVSPTISRTVVLCASRNIPLTNAASAIVQLAGEVAGQLCQQGAWPGARLLP